MKENSKTTPLIPVLFLLFASNKRAINNIAQPDGCWLTDESFFLC